MASSTKGGGGGDMKGFYRQKKKGAISKNPSSKSARSSSSSSSSAKQNSPAATLGSSVTQPRALVSPHLSDEYDEREELLRQFDLNMTYGPCLGMTRLARWERAFKLGMNPPSDVARLLKLPQARLDSLWEGCV